MSTTPSMAPVTAAGAATDEALCACVHACLLRACCVPACLRACVPACVQELYCRARAPESLSAHHKDLLRARGFNGGGSTEAGRRARTGLLLGFLLRSLSWRSSARQSRPLSSTTSPRTPTSLVHVLQFQYFTHYTRRRATRARGWPAGLTKLASHSNQANSP